MIIKYLVNNELYKSAKKIKLESKIQLDSFDFPIYEKKLEHIIGFYNQYWKALGEPGKRKGSIRKASTEINNLTETTNTSSVKQSALKKSQKTKSTKATKASKAVPKKKTVVKKKIIKKKIIKKKTPVKKSLLGKRNDVEVDPAPVPVPKKKKITKKQKQEKLENRRINKQKKYQKFKESSEADTLVNKNLEVKVNRPNTFSRCANVKKVKIDLFDSKWSNKVRKGGEDGFGSLGFQRLAHTRGKNFKKEKHKLKNREFQGSKITFKNNLIDLD
jgi:hypothetical protein